MTAINFDHQIQTAQLRLQAMQTLADGSSNAS
jgi:hypothetical protein